MTIKTPSTSERSPDTSIKATAPVTFDEIRDSSDSLIGENGTTYDKNLTFKGTSEVNTALWLRDDRITLTDMTSSASGSWVKQFTLSDFKRYKISAIEKKPPQNFSKNKTFVLATETPIINSVVGKDGAIEYGGTYDGDSVEITGNAPPDVEVEAFNGDATTGKKAMVNADGLFKLTLDELETGPYNIKIKAPNNKESIVFMFTVAASMPLSLDDVLDDNGTSVDEGDTTIHSTPTIKGKARKNGELTLLGGQPASVTVTTNDSGVWEHTFRDLPVAPYSLTARTNYKPVETTTPRTFTVVLDVELSLDDVLESEEGPTVPDAGTTYKDLLIIKGRARPGKSIQLLNGGTPIEDATVTTDPVNGAWKIPLKVSEGAYSLTAKANYGEGDVTAPPYTFNVESTIKPHSTRIYDTYGPIEDNGSTTQNYVYARGLAAPLEAIKLKINGVIDERSEPANEKGNWVKLVSELTPETKYVISAVAQYGDNAESNTWTITVAPAMDSTER
jgi:hypothetical protein